MSAPAKPSSPRRSRSISMPDGNPIPSVAVKLAPLDVYDELASVSIVSPPASSRPLQSTRQRIVPAVASSDTWRKRVCPPITRPRGSGPASRPQPQHPTFLLSFRNQSTFIRSGACREEARSQDTICSERRRRPITNWTVCFGFRSRSIIFAATPSDRRNRSSESPSSRNLFS
jgi:hypothetical protein